MLNAAFSLDEHRADGDGGKENSSCHKSPGEQRVAEQSRLFKTRPGSAWQDQQKLELAERASARDRCSLASLRVGDSVVDAGR